MQIKEEAVNCKHTGSYEAWLDLTDEDKVWSAAIREYRYQIEQSVKAGVDAERGDCLLWSLIQSGLSRAEGEKMTLSDSLLQVKRYSAVGFSRLLWQIESEKAQNDKLERNLKSMSDTMFECDKAMTVSPA
jgi:hypothetical protein